uniref:Uncharacterized protein n=1 Tax=Pithovirus LCDPAC01 TaxID=2506600 RepID=A0A481YQI9_9VIRU|nr:MAG: hypothetical protein LCDPAC01_01720 [Pithovirus LCDPAC01]
MNRLKMPEMMATHELTESEIMRKSRDLYRKETKIKVLVSDNLIKINVPRQTSRVTIKIPMDSIKFKDGPKLDFSKFGIKIRTPISILMYHNSDFLRVIPLCLSVISNVMICDIDTRGYFSEKEGYIVISPRGMSSDSSFTVVDNVGVLLYINQTAHYDIN